MKIGAIPIRLSEFGLQEFGQEFRWNGTESNVLRWEDPVSGEAIIKNWEAQCTNRS
jgi:hypothetical protein